jgi:hypothetical protein
MKRSPAAIRAALTARRNGQTMKEAAAAAGVHFATLCRWQAADPKLRAALFVGLPSRARPRPRLVEIHPECPKCLSTVVVRTAYYRLATYWRCSRWPRCRWASWRPRYPEDCSQCSGPVYYSKSRLSASCPRCRLRWQLKYRRNRGQIPYWLR